uniref:Sodium/calcium exchanger membrane region domain-containing protein n=1 Tax=Meleagris gallopavo TaxID=9103 RepID=G1NGY4_MELGA
MTSFFFKEEEERRIAEMGRPVLGEHTKLEVIIEESYEFKNTVDKLIKKTNLALVVGTNSWREQFIEAITVSAGEDDDDDECGEEKLPSCFDYVMHFLTVFWKVLFAFVPPTDYWNGWACFVVSILMIGILTAFIGDLASHFGCTIGLKDSVTAVVFVALGTSVPGKDNSRVCWKGPSLSSLVRGLGWESQQGPQLCSAGPSEGQLEMNMGVVFQSQMRQEDKPRCDFTPLAMLSRVFPLAKAVKPLFLWIASIALALRVGN